MDCSFALGTGTLPVFAGVNLRTERGPCSGAQLSPLYINVHSVASGE
jgi:hypothetical protein